MIKLADILKEAPCDECGRNWNNGQDHEASMANNELRDMISNASKIDSLVGDNDQLPGWVSAYISLAADYMHSVAEYLAGESVEPEHQPGPGYNRMMEAKPSAGLTKKEKSTVAKKAAAGKDIGKKGKGFEKVAKAAEKKYGSKEAGEKVAAAAMWKNIKR
jgi:sialic acid synthase SpsE